MFELSLQSKLQNTQDHTETLSQKKSRIKKENQICIHCVWVYVLLGCDLFIFLKIWDKLSHLFVCWDNVSLHIPGYAGIHYADQAGIKPV